MNCFTRVIAAVACAFALSCSPAPATAPPNGEVKAKAAAANGGTDAWLELPESTKAAIVVELSRLTKANRSDIMACLERESAQGNRRLDVILEDCSGGGAADEANPIATAQTASAPPPPPPPPPSAWTYQTTRDEMRDAAIHHACTVSTNTVRLDFPYETQTVRLCVRQHPRFGQDVFIRLTQGGQFLCRSYDGCTVRIRFDEGEPSGFSARGPSDHSSDTLFILNNTRFIAAVKRSSRVIIEAEFYRAGNQQMTFSTNGLEWPRP